MNKSNSMEAIDKTDLSEQTKFRLDEISKIKNYLIEEINQRKSCTKKWNKYITAFGYIDQALIVLSAASGEVSIISLTTFFQFFSLTTGITKKLLNITRKKKKKDDKILMLAKSKLSSSKTLISQALVDMDISPEVFITILKEKDKYEKMKENLRSENEKSYKVMTLSSVKSKT